MNGSIGFAEAMRAAGLEPPAEIIADGQLHRFATNGRSGDSAGWYVCHADGVPAGAFGDWRAGISGTWKAAGQQALSEEERREQAARIRAAKRKAADARRDQHAKAAAAARRIWEAAPEAPADHPYLVRKHIEPHDARLAGDGRLIVPAGINGKLASLQFIAADGSKRFLPGGATGGAYANLGDPNAAAELLIAEGFATAATLRELTGLPVLVAFSAGNLEAVATHARKRFTDHALTICADDDWRTETNPGLTKATQAAELVGARLAVPVFGEGRGEKDTDFNDLAGQAGPEAVLAAIREAKILEAQEPEQPAPPDDQTEAHLKPEEGTSEPVSERFERSDPYLGEGTEHILSAIRSEVAPLTVAAFRLLRPQIVNKYGVEAGVVNAVFKEIRDAARAAQAAAAQEARAQDSRLGQKLEFREEEAWSEHVSGDDLLAGITGALQRFIVFPSIQAVYAVALYVLFTYVYDSMSICPLLLLLSAVKGAGKTRTLNVLAKLIRRPIATSNSSAAALYRAIQYYAPVSLLVDEIDLVFGRSAAKSERADELRNLLNSGHTVGTAFVLRCSGEEMEPKAYSTFAAKIVAGLGTIPETVLDRSIIIRLNRKVDSEKVMPFSEIGEHGDLGQLRQQIVRWVEDNREAILLQDPPRIPELRDRQNDNWAPLLKIASAAGENWLGNTMDAARVLSAENDEAEDLKVQLLRDLAILYQDVPEKLGLHTETILVGLKKLEGRSWEWLTPRKLAQQLRQFGPKPETVHIPIPNTKDINSKKGYKLGSLWPIFQRYADPEVLKKYVAYPSLSTRPNVQSVQNVQEGAGDD